MLRDEIQRQLAARAAREGFLPPGKGDANESAEDSLVRQTGDRGRALDLLSAVSGYPPFDPDAGDWSAGFAREFSELLPSEILREIPAFPIRKTGRYLHVATSDPGNSEAIARLEALSGNEVVPYVALEDSVRRSLEALSRCKQPFLGDAEATERRALETALEREEGVEERSPVLRLVQILLRQAADGGASDLHFEPEEGCLRVRARVDGKLRTLRELPRSLSRAVARRLKIMADIPSAEDVPGDGRIGRRLVEGTRLSCRVSSIPSLHGERVVVRLIDEGRRLPALDDVGFSADQLETVRRRLAAARGMIVVTGATGSGKTTTLYALLESIRSDEISISTVEDPIERALEGVTQIACGRNSKVSFADALRSLLRQDPDVLLVGEMRDAETVEVAVRAALTGHLVLSSLHTTGAAGAVFRLMNAGVEPVYVASGLSLVIAQRLVRRLCANCRTPTRPTDREKRLFDSLGAPLPRGEYHAAAGCEACRGTGFAGRLPLFEMIEADEAFRDAVMRGAPERDLAGLVRARMASRGVDAAAAGRTTLSEVLGAVL